MSDHLDRVGRLDGRVIVVTGGALGIGRGIAIAAAQHGATVASMDLDDEASDALARALADVAPDRRHVVARGDATRAADVEGFVRRVVDELGAPHGLVNNVGGNFGYSPFAELDLDTLERTLGLNVGAAFLFSQTVLPAMIEAGGGRIVNIASIAADRAIPGLSAYSVAKAGIVALTRSMAIELASTGVMVNAVSPGHVVTPASLRIVPPEIREARDAIVPTGAQGCPEDIAATVTFLLTDARYLTGAVLPVDGGMTAAMPRPMP